MSVPATSVITGIMILIIPVLGIPVVVPSVAAVPVFLDHDLPTEVNVDVNVPVLQLEA